MRRAHSIAAEAGTYIAYWRPIQETVIKVGPYDGVTGSPPVDAPVARGHDRQSGLSVARVKVTVVGIAFRASR